MSEDDIVDESYQLIERGLFVRPPTRPIDLNTVPRDGNEFIHKSRLENAKLRKDMERTFMKKRASKGVKDFESYASALERDMAILKKKFPKKLTFPQNGPDYIQEWCTFCLGSKLCSKIYQEMYEEPSEKIEGHDPILSIIVHFSQDEVFTLLKNLHNWFLSLGMEHALGQWIYALLACMRKPLYPGSKELLETLYEDCEKRLKVCDKFEEKSRLYLISGILECYFPVNSD